MPLLKKQIHFLFGHAFLLLVLLMASISTSAQDGGPLTIFEAFRLADQNYPLLHQKDLIRQSEKLNRENLDVSFLPQFNVNGQATYQSDVTHFNIQIPGFKQPLISKDQYKLVGELDQMVYDAGTTHSQQEIQELNASLEEARVDVDLYQLHTRVSQLYFGILLQDQLLQQTDLVLKDIQAGIDKVKPQVQSGTALRSSLQVLEVQYLQTQQRSVEMRATKRGLVNALALYVGKPLSAFTVLEIPDLPDASDTVVQRPELGLYQRQVSLLNGQEKLIHTRNLPRASVFFQGGMGRPGLNLFSNQLQPFYITGLRLNWSLGAMYNNERDRKLLDIQRQTVDIQRSVFLLNTQAQLRQQESDISKYVELIASDEKIIDLRHQITIASQAQLENAVITSNDYLVQVDAEDAARQSLIMHRLQWQQAKLNAALTLGKR
ncbi:MAG: TolC family protein [Flavisolibacter sp.]